MRLIVPIVLFAAAACVLPRPDDVEFLDDDPDPTTSDDDDDATDDDDAVDDDDVADDDDAVDDDDASTGLPPCDLSGSAMGTEETETEPNNSPNTSDYVGEGDGEFVFYGQLAECGYDENSETYSGDRDWWSLRLACRGLVQVAVSWNQDTTPMDVDFTVSVPELSLTVTADTRGYKTPEQTLLDLRNAEDRDADGALDFSLRVVCYSGAPGEYQVSVIPM